VTKVNSTAPPRSVKLKKIEKPSKPHKDFPLFPHANGQWAKKVRQKMRFFGVWADPKAALQRWLDEKDDLLAGRVPRCRTGVVQKDVAKLCLDFLDSKQALLRNGELSPYTWNAYEAIVAEILAEFGYDRLLTDIKPDDFLKLRMRWAAKWGVERLASEINRCRIVFNFAFKNGLIAVPMQFGEGFKRPSKKSLRLNKAVGGVRMFEADELRRMIDGAMQPLRTMLLLAINAGMGNNDIGLMPLVAVDLESGWLNYPRPKTGILRRCPLWPETVASIKAWLSERPIPKAGSEHLVFLTVRGEGWAKHIAGRPITHECRKLLDRLKIGGKRNFYNVRHNFETIAGESKDQIAVDAIMGHDDGSMAANYRERLSDARLRAVAEHVRAWLFNDTTLDGGDA